MDVSRPRPGAATIGTAAEKWLAGSRVAGRLPAVIDRRVSRRAPVVGHSEGVKRSRARQIIKIRRPKQKSRRLMQRHCTAL